MIRSNYFNCSALLLFSVLVCSCATSSGPKYVPSVINKGEALIYVYRTKNVMLGEALKWDIMVNDEKVGIIGGGNYISYSTSKSHITISTLQPENEVVNLDILPGYTYYVKLELGSFFSKEYAIGKLVSQDIGSIEIIGTRLYDYR